MSDQCKIVDPIRFAKLLWPHVTFYREQREIIYSVARNDETFCVAGNALGKDFVAAFIALWWMCSRRPARAVTTSVKYEQLNDVLWGEIRWFLRTAKYPLPIEYTHNCIYQVDGNGKRLPKSELVAQVAAKGEGLLGRHLPMVQNVPRTLAIFDEASGIDDVTYNSCLTWAHTRLVIGNPWPCTNFFYKGIKEGDQKSTTHEKLWRRVIKVKAEHSPNVLLAQKEINEGKKPSHTILIPGVKSYADYVKHRATWDKIMQCIGLDAEFYEGAENLMFPPEWLNQAEINATNRTLRPDTRKTMGVDPAEGGDETVWTVIDETGILEIQAQRTSDTTQVPNVTQALIVKYRIEPEDVVFDRGGGGKEHADVLRARDLAVRTVAFGESASAPDRFSRYLRAPEQKVKEAEHFYVYKNRRSEMYGLLRLFLNPNSGYNFSIPARYGELRKQLSPLPLLYDGEGRLALPPKRIVQQNSTRPSMTKICGGSPDHADSLVLALYSLVYEENAFEVTMM